MVKLQQSQPLANLLRPQKLAEVVGQTHILGPNKPLSKLYEQQQLHSMVFWGPPGTGKTTLAMLLSKRAGLKYISLSAVFAGVKDIRAALEEAAVEHKVHQKPMVLFIDEIHRFNKAQQDAFLQPLEEGSIILIGATTENPSFELNSALLSRARVYPLKALTNEELKELLHRSLDVLANEIAIDFPIELHDTLIQAADGDGRRLINFIQVLVDIADNDQGMLRITKDSLSHLLLGNLRRFDKGGDVFYDQISALHKSVRGTDPNAALYWFNRMIDGGCDPRYICRRILRMASEDIGNADPRALSICLDATQAYERLGSPEGELAIGQAIVYLACAPKSNAVYMACSKAMADVKQTKSYEVPLHLRNAPTKLMSQLGYGKNYRYAHNEINAYAADEKYFPDEMQPREYYQPANRGLEIKIKEKLEQLKLLDQQAGRKEHAES